MRRFRARDEPEGDEEEGAPVIRSARSERRRRAAFATTGGQSRVARLSASPGAARSVPKSAGRKKSPVAESRLSFGDEVRPPTALALRAHLYRSRQEEEGPTFREKKSKRSRKVKKWGRCGSLRRRAWRGRLDAR